MRCSLASEGASAAVLGSADRLEVAGTDVDQSPPLAGQRDLDHHRTGQLDVDGRGNHWVELRELWRIRCCRLSCSVARAVI